MWQLALAVVPSVMMVVVAYHAWRSHQATMRRYRANQDVQRAMAEVAAALKQWAEELRQNGG